MGLNLWWKVNDGIGGHAWLSAGDMLSLREEMLAQGMAWESRKGELPGARRGIPTRKLAPKDRAVITPREIEQALEAASPEPKTLPDRKLWQDWLAFLEGGRTRGGILVRP